MKCFNNARLLLSHVLYVLNCTKEMYSKIFNEQSHLLKKTKQLCVVALISICVLLFRLVSTGRVNTTLCLLPYKKLQHGDDPGH